MYFLFAQNISIYLQFVDIINKLNMYCGYFLQEKSEELK